MIVYNIGIFWKIFLSKISSNIGKLSDTTKKYDVHFVQSLQKEVIKIIKIDTLKIKVEYNDIKNKDIFTHCSKSEGDKKTEYFKINRYIQGLNDIVIFPDFAIITLSSKILKENYLEGINRNNIIQVFEELEKYISINYKNIIVLRADIIKNIQIPQEEKADFINSLRSLQKIGKYKIFEFYENESIVFQKDLKTVKDRITVYDKKAELEAKEKDDTGLFLKIKDIENIIRVELNIVEQKRIKALFKCENTLQNILNSKINPLQELWKKNFLKEENIKTIYSDEEIYINHYMYLLENSRMNVKLIEENIKKSYSRRTKEKHLQYLESAKENIMKKYNLNNINILENINMIA